MSGNDGFTKILLHFDGANGSASIIDYEIGGLAHTWTNHTGSISTAQSKFGGASYDTTTGGWVDTPDSADLNLGNGDFTIDCWIYRAGGDGTLREFCGQADSAVTTTSLSFAIALASDNKLAAAVAAGSVQTNLAGVTAITTAGWHHVALVRTGNVLKLFLDGVQEGADTPYSSVINDSASKLSVGKLGEYAGAIWNGYVDEFRLSVGIARWTANFTPPIAAYSIDPLVANTGSFTLNGQPAAFRILQPVTFGSYAWSGQPATFQIRGAEAFGSVALTGQAATLKTQFVSSSGSFSLFGQDAALTPGLGALNGSFSETGFAATFEESLLAGFGSFVLSGQDVLEPILGTETGQFTLTGQDAFLSHEFSGGGGTISGGTFSRGRWRALQEEIAAEREREARLRRRERERRRAVARRAAAAAKAAREAARAKEDAVRAELARHRAAAGGLNAVAGARSIAAAADGSARLVGAAQAARAVAAARDEDEALALLLAA